MSRDALHLNGDPKAQGDCLGPDEPSPGPEEEPGGSDGDPPSAERTIAIGLSGEDDEELLGGEFPDSHVPAINAVDAEDGAAHGISGDTGAAPVRRHREQSQPEMSFLGVQLVAARNEANLVTRPERRVAGGEVLIRETKRL